jgi:hypothetical protein
MQAFNVYMARIVLWHMPFKVLEGIKDPRSFKGPISTHGNMNLYLYGA